jgi:N utilization substance protein B
VDKTSKKQARRLARERALQALYQWDITAADASAVRKEIIERQEMDRVDLDYFTELFNGVSHDVDSVDTILAKSLDRPIAELDPIERSVLRLCCYELSEQLATPARVVINEGIEITKRYGADQGHKYINGVLDKLALVLRSAEMKAAKR